MATERQATAPFRSALTSRYSSLRPHHTESSLSCRSCLSTLTCHDPSYISSVHSTLLNIRSKQRVSVKSYICIHIISKNDPTFLKFIKSIKCFFNPRAGPPPSNSNGGLVPRARSDFAWAPGQLPCPLQNGVGDEVLTVRGFYHIAGSFHSVFARWIP